MVVNYEGLWNSHPSEAYLRFYFEPLGPWIESAINNETPIHSSADLLGGQLRIRIRDYGTVAA